MNTSKPSTAERSNFPQRVLAEAINTVLLRLEDFGRMNRTFDSYAKSLHPDQAVIDELYDKKEKAKNVLIEEIETAVTRLKGVDPIMQSVKGTRPGEYHYGVSNLLHGLHAEVVRNPDHITLNEKGRAELDDQWVRPLTDVMRELWIVGEEDFQQGLNTAASGGKAIDITSQEWSKPMSKSEMMRALKIDGYKKFNSFAKRFGLRQSGNRQLWQIRLDDMDKNMRKLLDKT